LGAYGVAVASAGLHVFHKFLPDDVLEGSATGSLVCCVSFLKETLLLGLTLPVLFLLIVSLGNINRRHILPFDLILLLFLVFLPLLGDLIVVKTVSILNLHEMVEILFLSLQIQLILHPSSLPQLACGHIMMDFFCCGVDEWLGLYDLGDSFLILHDHEFIDCRHCVKQPLDITFITEVHVD
jgi:hypothetical protein